VSSDHDGDFRQDRTERQSFSALMAKAQQGDREAVGELVDQCRNYLLLIANQEMDRDFQGKLGPSDIVQESMIAAQDNFGRFAGTTQEQLLGWLRGFLLNGMRDATRRYKGLKKRQVGREQSLDGLSKMPSLADHLCTPGTQAVANEEAALLSKALSRLPADYQQVIRLRNWDRLSFVDIGTQMGRSDEAVRKLWSRALLQLQVEFTSSAQRE
jgi:RNA polymerase sigma-70 factor (ECF subfamily)